MSYVGNFCWEDYPYIQIFVSDPYHTAISHMPKHNYWSTPHPSFYPCHRRVLAGILSLSCPSSIHPSVIHLSISFHLVGNITQGRLLLLYLHPLLFIPATKGFWPCQSIHHQLARTLWALYFMDCLDHHQTLPKCVLWDCEQPYFIPVRCWNYLCCFWKHIVGTLAPT